MNKRLLFVYNPKSGKAQIRNHLLDIIDVFVKAKYEVIVRPTQCAGDATKVVNNIKDDINLVVCSGGDGTLDEVVAGMQTAEKKLPIGYIPAGSTNDFARSLGIPFDMVKAARVAVKGKKVPVDIGLFNDKTFVYVAAFGVFADVSYQTEQDLKNVLGHAAYILEGMKLLPSVRAYHMQLEYLEEVNACITEGDEVNSQSDKVEIIEDDFILGMITNSLSVGGFSNLTDPDTKLDDGVFEVLLIKKPQNPFELNGVIASLLNRDFSSPLLVNLKVSNLSIKCSEPVSWTLDGEFGGQMDTVQVKNIPQALEIMVPNTK